MSDTMSSGDFKQPTMPMLASIWPDTMFNGHPVSLRHPVNAADTIPIRQLYGVS